MDPIKTMESMALENISNNSDTVVLSYESYFREACNHMMACESILQNDITQVDNMYATTAKVLKQHFARSQEDVEAVKIVKRDWKENIKQWFVKIWAFIVSIFEKIALAVVSFVKSMIVYITKKRMASKDMVENVKAAITKLQTENNTPALTEILTILSKQRCKSFDIGRRRDFATIYDIHEMINNDKLKQFLQKNTVYVNNSKSIFNLRLLEEILKTNVNEKITNRMVLQNMTTDQIATMLQQYSKEDKLVEIENNVNALLSQAVLCGETPNNMPLSNTGFVDSWISEVFTEASYYWGHGTGLSKPDQMFTNNNGIIAIANYLTYGVPKTIVMKSNIRTGNFFKMPMNGEMISMAGIQMLPRAMDLYLQDYVTVCGNGGYIDQINDVLKKYTAKANEDAKHIKHIKEYIEKQLVIIENTTDYHNIGSVNYNNALKGQVKRYTQIINKVTNVKTHFVALRQYIIGNLISMLSMEESAVKIIINAVNKKHLTIDEKEAEEITVKIGEGRPLQTPKDSPYYEDDLSDEHLHSKEGLSDVIHNIGEKLENEVGPALAEKIEKIDVKLDEKINKLEENGAKLDKKTDEIIEKISSKIDGDSSDNEDNPDDYLFDEF